MGGLWRPPCWGFDPPIASWSVLEGWACRGRWRRRNSPACHLPSRLEPGHMSFCEVRCDLHLQIIFFLVIHFARNSRITNFQRKVHQGRWRKLHQGSTCNWRGLSRSWISEILGRNRDYRKRREEIDNKINNWIWSSSWACKQPPCCKYQWFSYYCWVHHKIHQGAEGYWVSQVINSRKKRIMSCIFITEILWWLEKIRTIHQATSNSWKIECTLKSTKKYKIDMTGT